MTLAQRLKQELERDGRTRYRLAADADLDRATLSRILDGTSDHGWKKLSALAIALKLTPERFGAILLASLRDEIRHAARADDESAKVH